MIEPIKFSSNVSFRGSETPLKKEQPQAVDEKELKDEFKTSDNNEETTAKSSPADIFNNAKTKALNFFKGINNVTYTTKGTIKGAVTGTIAAAIVGVIGKNVKNGEGKILPSARGIAADTFTGIKNIIGFIPSLITKSPLENVKDVVTLPAKFFGKNYLNVLNKAGEGVKTHKATAVIATLVGLGTFALGAILGKVRANEHNADLDHKTNHGHIK